MIRQCFPFFLTDAKVYIASMSFILVFSLYNDYDNNNHKY